jgi:hypothetical protein
MEVQCVYLSKRSSPKTMREIARLVGKCLGENIDISTANKSISGTTLNDLEIEISPRMLWNGGQRRMKRSRMANARSTTQRLAN